MDYTTLKARHRQERDSWPNNLSLRVHRALSWLERSEQCDDADGRFIFLWIAFNGAYAQELGSLHGGTERERFGLFLAKLVELDTSNRLHQLLWDTYSGTVRVLLDNKYVFQPFWDAHHGDESASDWETRFVESKSGAHRALARSDTATVLSIVLTRLYTLRNQLMHGGATWNGSINRDQLRDCSKFLGELVPTMILVMMEHPNTLWGDACYPVVES
ncbi:HEPN domain-containing protein [Congregibacter litoralis]|uniref:Uncharacterized protein n=1 Tax=Congregibacter litoralis KT71 TaxID=314285 RepID=A4AD42_9GAMM|nr:HEPN domain-containing protein [Congregibacter litoralis]EAQ96095.1 hypothetical protein KT71_08565 [Congregibacter litoralis KT71]